MVAGKYKTSGKIMGSRMECDVEYIVDGEMLSGSLFVMGDTVIVNDGIVNGDHFTHTGIVDTPMGKINVKINGDVDGDNIKFILKTPIAKAEFTGIRV